MFDGPTSLPLFDGVYPNAVFLWKRMQFNGAASSSSCVTRSTSEFFLISRSTSFVEIEELSPSNTADGKEVSEFGGRARYSFHVPKETTRKESCLRRS